MATARSRSPTQVDRNRCSASADKSSARSSNRWSPRNEANSGLAASLASQYSSAMPARSSLTVMAAMMLRSRHLSVRAPRMIDAGVQIDRSVTLSGGWDARSMEPRPRVTGAP